MTGKLGIVAGGGRLPGLLIDACRNSGREYFVLALKGQADPTLVARSPHAWIRMGAAATGFRILHEQGVVDLVMAGHVRRPSLVDLRPDLRTVKFFAKLGRKGVGDDGLLRAVIRELEDEGFRVVGADELLPDLQIPQGALGCHTPDGQANADIARGMGVLAALSKADVGQSVVVQQGIVLGVEAVEGTDALIERCGALRREGAPGVLIKFPKSGQETRVDLPTIGPDTVRRAAAAGLGGIAVAADATIVVDQAEVIRIADEAGLFVVGVPART